MATKNIKQTTLLTDGGLETDLIFNKGIDLPHFAAFPLVECPEHQHTLKSYYKAYMDLAKTHQTGYILESPTWRANPDWGYKLGYSKADLSRINQKAITQLNELRTSYKNDIETILISGCIGPRGDGYIVDEAMTIDEAEIYHNTQVSAFKESKADLVTAITMNYINEAIGIAKAAKSHNIPVVISFTVETNGHLPSGEPLKEAIQKVDNATNNYPLYFMINCAHPTHFINKIEKDSSWKSRIHGVRANASCKSHEELDQSTQIDVGDKVALGALHIELKSHLPNLNVYGGCCGTDVSHVSSICNHVL